ncbi:hypothetical protein D3C86_2106320 [compost metagenome]
MVEQKNAAHERFQQRADALEFARHNHVIGVFAAGVGNERFEYLAVIIMKIEIDRGQVAD